MMRTVTVTQYLAVQADRGERLHIVPDMLDLVHWTLTGIMGWFAYAMLSPRVEMAGPAWRQFLELATESHWGLIFLAVALIGLVGAVVSTGWINMTSTFLLGSAHGCLAVCFYMGAPNDPTRPTAVGTYALIALLGWSLTIRRLLVTFGAIEQRVLVLKRCR